MNHVNLKINKMMLKIEEQELKGLQEVVSAINSMKSSIGEMEVRKHEAMHQLFSAETNLREQQEALKGKYGNVTVSLSDGTIKPVEDEPNTED